MPKPHRHESKEAFVARYMASPEARASFPDAKQRLAVAYSIYDRPNRRKQRGKKQMTTEEFLKSISGRAVGLYGAASASLFVQSIHQQSPRAELLSLASDDRWEKELKDASGRVVWSDEGQEILEKSLADGAGITPGSILEYDAVLSSRRRDRDNDILEPKGITVDTKMPLLWQHLQLQPIGKLVKVLSQDDERLVCKFAIADTALGRDAATLVRFGALRKSHGFKPVPGQFEPVEILKGTDGNPLRDKDGNLLVKGWHIKQANTYEGSLVSIPANADGVVTQVYEKQFSGVATAFSRNELKTELVKCWAKSIYDKRPTVVPGVTLDTKSADASASGGASWKCDNCGTSNVVSSVPDGVDLATIKCAICGQPKSAEKSHQPAGTKAGRAISKANEQKLRDALAQLTAILDDAGLSDDPQDQMADSVSEGLDVVLGKGFVAAGQKSLELATKSSWDDEGDLLPGSYEYLASKLQEQAGRYLMSQMLITSIDSGYVRTMATFPSEAIVCFRDWSQSPTINKCYRIAYTVDQDGMPKFSGTAQPVEIKLQVIEKALRVLAGPSAPATPDTLTSLSRKFAAQLVMAGSLGGEAGQAVETLQKAVTTVRQMADVESLGSVFNNN